MPMPITNQNMDSATIPALAGADALQHIGGGFETDVYRTTDGRFVVKRKREALPSTDAARREARRMQRLTRQFSACLGPEHTIATTYIVAGDAQGRPGVLAIQPWLAGAQPLDTLRYAELDHATHLRLLHHLLVIIARARRCYRAHGIMPDLYGLPGGTAAWPSRAPHHSPRLVWDFLVRRTLLRSHNLLLTAAPQQRVVLVDYDLAYRQYAPWLRRLYFTTRFLLLWRDRWLIARRLRALAAAADHPRR
ncbi:hypothetical protein [Kallotenue papyrolyticum]|uniref:hypothetical protein n=1 Tax=Kallotenue papyrolyticum TaxID=1325125 RepID=UPI00049281E2|nr:hypothetical protein [Kallotenue papyrolyticum]